MHSQADLLEIVDALGSPSGLAGGLDGGKQKRDEHGDDRDHHQKLNERETLADAHSMVHGGEP